MQRRRNRLVQAAARLSKGAKLDSDESAFAVGRGRGAFEEVEVRRDEGGHLGGVPRLDEVDDPRQFASGIDRDGPDLVLVPVEAGLIAQAKADRRGTPARSRAPSSPRSPG